MAQYLVTGGVGFIGWRTCELLLAQGHSVVAFDSINDYYDVRIKRWRLAALERNANFKFFYGDLNDEDALGAAFAHTSYDAVIHLAAQAGVRASWQDPVTYQRSNVEGLVRVLQHIQLVGIAKLVLASTSSLYAGKPLPWRENLDVSRPRTPYAASKLAAEALAHTWHCQYGLDVSVVRYFTVYGPAGRPDMAPFRFVQAILDGTPLRLYGDGAQSRDFTFIDDIARGTIAALAPGGYDCFNLGGGREPAVLREVIALIEGLAGREAIIERFPVAPGDFATSQADVSHANEVLGWSPQVGLREGFAATVAWHLEHQNWLRGLDQGPQ